MFKKLNKKGFTLAELLVVVAIIGVLVAISIPIFTSQLEKSREAVDKANIRAAYAEVIADNLNDGASHSKNVSVNQTQAKWQGDGDASKIDIGGYSAAAKTSGHYTVKVSKDGTISIS